MLAGLTSIAQRSDEILTDIADALPEQAEAAVVFGSVARGDESARSDIDVLVLGDHLSSLKVNARLKPVGRKHHREIHATVASRREFEEKLADGEGFASNVVLSPFIPLKGEFKLPACTADTSRHGVRRLHSTLDYISPVTFEQNWFAAQQGEAA